MLSCFSCLSTLYSPIDLDELALDYLGHSSEHQVKQYLLSSDPSTYLGRVFLRPRDTGVNLGFPLHTSRMKWIFLVLPTDPFILHLLQPAKEIEWAIATHPQCIHI
jgi:hypothetical protein